MSLYHTTWCGVPLDKLSKHERAMAREHLDREESRWEADWRSFVDSPYSYPPSLRAVERFAEIRRTLDQLDYIEETEFTLLGAARIASQ